MYANTKLSELIGLVATLDPATPAVGTLTTGWVSAAGAAVFMAVLQTGAMGASGTIDAKLQQATDSLGTGAKDVVGKAITTLAQPAGSNKQATISCKQEDLDLVNGFGFLRLSVNVGVAASPLSALLLAGFPRLSDQLGNQAAVVQQI